MLVSRNPEIVGGEACFIGTRVSVRTLFDHVSAESVLREVLHDSPLVSQESSVGVLEQSFQALQRRVPKATRASPSHPDDK